jgi:hypothetical protein
VQNKDSQEFCSFIPLEDIMTIDEAREYSTIVKVTCQAVRHALLRRLFSHSVLFGSFAAVFAHHTQGRIITIKFDSTENKSLWLDHFVVIVAAHRQKTARYNPGATSEVLSPRPSPAAGHASGPHGFASEESEFESF